MSKIEEVGTMKFKKQAKEKQFEIIIIIICEFIFLIIGSAHGCGFYINLVEKPSSIWL